MHLLPIDCIDGVMKHTVPSAAARSKQETLSVQSSNLIISTFIVLREKSEKRSSVSDTKLVIFCLIGAFYVIYRSSHMSKMSAQLIISSVFAWICGLSMSGVTPKNMVELS